jgi:hypothetical protein
MHALRSRTNPRTFLQRSVLCSKPFRLAVMRCLAAWLWAAISLAIVFRTALDDSLKLCCKCCNSLRAIRSISCRFLAIRSCKRVVKSPIFIENTSFQAQVFAWLAVQDRDVVLAMPGNL